MNIQTLPGGESIEDEDIMQMEALFEKNHRANSLVTTSEDHEEYMRRIKENNQVANELENGQEIQKLVLSKSEAHMKQAYFLLH